MTHHPYAKIVAAEAALLRLAGVVEVNIEQQKGHIQVRYDAERVKPGTIQLVAERCDSRREEKWFKEVEEKQKGKTVVVGPRDEGPIPSPAVRPGIPAAVRTDLSDTVWSIEVSPITAEVATKEHRLRFSNGHFSATLLSKQGFPLLSPYNVTEVELEGIAQRWQALQKGSRGGTLEWDAEWDGRLMTGSVHWKKPDGKIVRFSFTGKRAGGK